jgi:4-aminobutyrate aminotransferase-like enzyme
MHTDPVVHPGESRSNKIRRGVLEGEPLALRTFTPTQTVIAKSAGVFHWTADGRKLYDYSSGVLVANLGHNHAEWQKRFVKYMGWPEAAALDGKPYFEALPLTAYNAMTTIEAEAVQRLLKAMRGRPGGARMEQVMWAASGSEGIQKALWCALAFDKGRDVVVATRDGFHGKKGLAEAVTGNENDKNRDPRVRFISFPRAERQDVSMRSAAFDPAPYIAELRKLEAEFGSGGKSRIACLITEPYLGGGGSYHPPAAYLQLLQDFCRRNNAALILDEVQSNFGRTGNLFAYETYGLEPDVVVLGKGLTNGVAGAAAVGRADLFASLSYGEASDTWSANTLCCAAVVATLDIFEKHDILGPARKASRVIEAGLVRLKEISLVKAVRGEDGGMVWGVEIGDLPGRPAPEVAAACVLAAYHGDSKGRAVHLLGPLAKKVIRISPPLTITEAEAADSVECLYECFRAVERAPASRPAAAAAVR